MSILSANCDAWGLGFTAHQWYPDTTECGSMPHIWGRAEVVSFGAKVQRWSFYDILQYSDCLIPEPHKSFAGCWDEALQKAPSGLFGPSCPSQGKLQHFDLPTLQLQLVIVLDRHVRRWAKIGEDECRVIGALYKTQWSLHVAVVHGAWHARIQAKWAAAGVTDTFLVKMMSKTRGYVGLPEVTSWKLTLAMLATVPVESQLF